MRALKYATLGAFAATAVGLSVAAMGVFALWFGRTFGTIALILLLVAGFGAFVGVVFYLSSEEDEA